MITYALSAPSAFSDLVTESAAAALRESKFRNFEISFSKYTLDDVDETHWIPGQGSTTGRRSCAASAPSIIMCF